MEVREKDRKGERLRRAATFVQRAPAGPAPSWAHRLEGWDMSPISGDMGIDEVIAALTPPPTPPDTAALGDIRILLAAQAVFADYNGGAYAPLRCLRKPEACGAGPSGGPLIGDEPRWEGEWSGYRRTFHPGSPRAGGPADAITGFAFTAVPLAVSEPPLRSFCADDTGRVCFRTDGVAPEVKDGRCAGPCTSVP